MSIATDVTGTLGPARNFWLALRARRLRAVVADDSPCYLDVVCALLELDDIVDVIGRANDGAEAVQLALALEPDIVILDVEMPNMNGLVAATLICVHSCAAKIVMMSAEDSEERRAACLAAGADAFIFKPRFREQFLSNLRSLCEDSGIGSLPPSWQTD